jgi:hypothetical protein
VCCSSDDDDDDDDDDYNEKETKSTPLFMEQWVPNDDTNLINQSYLVYNSLPNILRDPLG